MPQAKPDSGAVLVVVPARWGSTRFPGKPLHEIAGKPLVRHVWERCLLCRGVDRVVVATDDARIQSACESFGAEVVMTSPDHPSGTDRAAEALAKTYPDAASLAGLINVQGDEPMIAPDLIDQLADCLRESGGADMITAATPLPGDASPTDPNIVKVVLNQSGEALYFSRSLIPYPQCTPGAVAVLRHLGIYGFRPGFLRDFVSWPPSPLERTESLEQLRALEHGARIRVVITGDSSPGVDTPEQAREVEALLTGKAFQTPPLLP